MRCWSASGSEACCAGEGSKRRTDSTHIQPEFVGEWVRRALNTLAWIAPEWLRARAPRAWCESCGARFGQSRLPKAESGRESLAPRIGQDGRQRMR